MVARGSIQVRQRLLEQRLTGLDLRFLAVYERMHVRELAYREQVFGLYPTFRVDQIPDRNGGSLHGRGPSVAAGTTDIRIHSSQALPVPSFRVCGG